MGARACFAAELNETQRAKGLAGFCFSRKEEYDIVIKGKKIGGNAQKRKKRLILQHGSIPFSFEKEKIARFLKNPEVLEGLDVASIHEITNKRVSFSNLSEILKDAFCRHFSTKLEKSGLDEKEEALAQQLEREKYANPEWNLYRVNRTIGLR